MSEDARDIRIRELELDVSQLRRQLDQRGATSALRHQVRNALGLMRSILRRSAETSESVSEFAGHVEGRFDALLRVQSLLTASIGRQASLHAIIANELLAHLIPLDERAFLTGPHVWVGSKCAEMLGLAFHELVTNSVKYGAMTAPAGRIAIGWSFRDEAQSTLDLIWRESGMTAAPPRSVVRGFGFETLELMLPYQLDAKCTLTFAPEGLLCELAFPAKAIAI